MGTDRWRPPLPPEHGAKTMLLVALGTAASIAIGSGVRITIETLSLFLALCGIGVGGLLFRAAVRTSLRPTSEEPRSAGRFLAVEGIALAVLIGVLVLGHHPGWALLALLIPGIAAEAWLSRHGVANPLRIAVIGVLGIGALVPAGLLLFGVTDPSRVMLGYGSFLGYHLLAVLRVGSTIGALGSARVIARLVPVVALGFAAVGYAVDVLGIGAPVVFGLSLLRSGQLEHRKRAPSLTRLGQGEAVLSVAFVLAGPWLLG